MWEKTVILVEPIDDVDAFHTALSTADRPVNVDGLQDISELMATLTKSVVHCLVVPATMADDDATRIVHGVRGLFPAVPIVIVGEPDDAATDELDATVVPAESLTDTDVVEAVRSALDDDVTSDAARPPSRMETVLLSMLDGFPLHLYAKDHEGRHLLTGHGDLSPREMVGLTDLDFAEFPEAFRETAYADDLRVIEGGGRRLEVEEFSDHIDSHTLTSKVPWHGPDGELLGLVGVTRDITERKRREKARRRQHELLVKVALVAAHELRNELQVAAGRLELLDIDDEQLAVIEDSQRRLVNIVDRVVELASEERPGRAPEELWLSTIGREVWDSIDAGGATLEVVEDAPIVADRESLSLFLQILFKNAIQHGGVCVTVTVGATDDGFFVADDGLGLQVDPPERVFDAGYTTDPDSTGFGLYVARSIADDHDWSVTVGDRDSGGTRFDVHGVTHDDAPEHD